jgi:Tol biopolymer transport system component
MALKVVLRRAFPLGSCLRLAAALLAVTLPLVPAAGALAQTVSGATPSTLAPCAVSAATLLGDGGDEDWSATTDLLAYDKKDAAGNYQLYTANPHGSGATCLSCTPQSGAPPLDRHKVNPTWHASGQWLVVQVENEWHPLAQSRSDWEAELIINGMATDLYAVSADGQRWARLTTSPWPVAYGVMAPHFSADGTKLLWSQLVEPADASHGRPWGRYRLLLADFVVDGSGTPGLANVRDLTPSGGVFVEANGLSPDGTKVLFTSNMGSSDANNMDIWALDLATGATTKLTDSPNWDEHAAYAPSGRSIAYMAGDLGVWAMSADLMLMDANGANKRRLTAFNQAGQPGYTGELTMVLRPTWNKDGTRLAVTEQLANGYPGRRRLWALDFAGACGG